MYNDDDTRGTGRTAVFPRDFRSGTGNSPESMYQEVSFLSRRMTFFFFNSRNASGTDPRS